MATEYFGKNIPKTAKKAWKLENIKGLAFKRVGLKHKSLPPPKR